MKLYDGTGEHIPASDIKPGDMIRCPDQAMREVLGTSREGQKVVVACVDGFGFELPYTSRVLLKYADAS